MSASGQTSDTPRIAIRDGPRRAAALDGVPVFIGCHEQDPHIPLERVRESERVFAGLGAQVSVEIHPGAGHGVVEEELRHVRGLSAPSPLHATTIESTP